MPQARGIRQLTYGQARQEFHRRIASGEFRAINHRKGGLLRSTPLPK
jgi:hypothetical protein